MQAKAARTLALHQYLEVSRSDDFKVIHVSRVVKQVVFDAGSPVDEVTGRRKSFLVFTHESSPALNRDHDDHLKFASSRCQLVPFLGAVLALKCVFSGLT